MKKIPIIIIFLIILFSLSFTISKIIEMPKTNNKIAVIPIEGMITSGSIIENPLIRTGSVSSSAIINYIEKAESDDSIKGIIFEINSPGGTVVASKEIADKIKKVKKPTVAWIREIGTSGAYWVASASDKIIVDEMSLTGSIGVVSSYLEFSGLMEKYGINYESLTAGEYKDTGSPYKKLTNKERELFQKQLNEVYNFFINEIKKNRNLKNDNFANGMFFLGIEAKDMGLVDDIGGKDLAVKTVKELAGIKEAELVTFKERTSLFSLLSKISAGSFYYIGKGIGSEMFKVENRDLRIVA